MSGIDETEEEKKEQGKTNEVHNALEKIIKLDRKNSTFDFVDDLHNIKMKIKSGQMPTGIPPITTKNEHSLRAYWRHASNFYFKKIDESQFARLDYLDLMLNAEIQEPKQLYYDWQTYLAINEVVDLKKQFSSPLEAQDQQNFLKHLFIDFTYAHSTETGDKKFINRMRQMVKDKDAFIPKNRNGKYYESELQKQARKLDEMVAYFHEDDPNEEDDDIRKELNAKLAELAGINSQNKERLKDLNQKIHLQVKSKVPLYFMNSAQEAKKYDFRNRQLLENTLNAYRTSNRVDLEVEFLRNMILRLDKKQVAESISKIVSCDRYRNEYRFTVVFQQALNLSPQIFSEEVLMELNDLREFTLLKFYNVSLKSMFSNISHVASGFQHVLKRRNQQNLLKTKDLIEIMKKAKISSDAQDKFVEFEMCHHCKQLYDKQILIGCSYRSSKMGFPVSTPSFVDPYIQQILQIDSSNNPSRQFATRKKNNYMTYTRKGNEYVCLRKYCKTCLKQSYDSIDKNGLCPFCQGVCFCTRCLRNDMITKYKTIFSQYGGDISEIQQNSLYESLVSKSATADRSLTNIRSEEELPVIHSRKLLRRKGRPKKVPTYRPKSNMKVYNHLKLLREQLEQCRMICHLAKRREKQKLKIFNCYNDLFRRKTDYVDQDIRLLKKFNFEKDSPNDQSTKTVEQQQDNFIEPPKRKLRRLN